MKLRVSFLDVNPFVILVFVGWPDRYLYTGRLDNSQLQGGDRQTLEDVAVRHSIGHLAECLLALDAARTTRPALGAIRRSTGRRSSATDLDSQGARQAPHTPGEEQLGSALRSLLTAPRSEGMGPPQNGADVRLLVEGKVVWAHRAVLVARSDPLRRRLLGPTPPSPPDHRRAAAAASPLDRLQQQMHLEERLGHIQDLKLEGIHNVRVLNDVLSFVYGGTSAATSAPSWDVIRAAKALGLPALCAAAEATLYRSVVTAEAPPWDVLGRAAAIGARQLKLQMLEYVASSEVPIPEAAGFLIDNDLKKEVDSLVKALRASRTREPRTIPHHGPAFGPPHP